jgi:hypothetical protein
MTSIFWQMEDDLKNILNGRQPQFCQMEDDPNILANRIRPQYFGIWKPTSLFLANGIIHISFENGRKNSFFPLSIGRIPQFLAS